MLTIGLDDPTVDYIIPIQSAKDSRKVLQMLGRAVRHRLYPKIAYVVAFNDINFSSALNKSSYTDPSAAPLIDQKYHKNKTTQIQQLKTSITKLSNQSSENTIDYHQQSELLRKYEKEDKSAPLVSSNKYCFNPPLYQNTIPKYCKTKNEQIIEQLTDLKESLNRLQGPQPYLFPTSPFSKDNCNAKIKLLQNQLKETNNISPIDIYKFKF